MQRFIYNILAISILLSLFSCGGKEEKVEQDTVQNKTETGDRIFISKAQFERSQMVLGSLTEQSFPVTVKVTGMIDVPPENRAVVSATMGGYIKTTPLLIGDKVRKGQALVTIENPEFVSIQQEYMEVYEQLTYLKSEYERQKTMQAENITSQKSFLQAESSFKTAKARYNGLRKQLQMLNISPARVEAGSISTVVTIYAPIAGSITKVNVTKGTYLSPATAILEIVNNEHIHLELSVFEKDIMKLKKGQRINFKIPESSTEIYTAEVYLIGTVIEDNRTIKIHGHLDDTSTANFLTGMFIEAEIVTESAFATALPSEAIVEVDNKAYVLILDSSENNVYHFNQEEVQVKNTHKGFSEISFKDVFTTETQFLTKGAFNLLGE